MDGPNSFATVFQEIFRGLFRIENDDIISQESRIDQVACKDSSQKS